MDFPRGGAPILLHHERKRLFKEAAADVYNSEKSKPISTLSKKTIANKQTNINKPSFGKSVSSLNKKNFPKDAKEKKHKRIRHSKNDSYKDLQFEDGLDALKSLQQDLPFISPLSKKNLLPGLELLGVVKKTNSSLSIIALPNSLQGKISNNSLKNASTLALGSLVQVRIRNEKSFRSLLPLELIDNYVDEIYHEKKEFYPGSAFMGVISSIEDTRGYLVTLGDKLDRPCFLPMNSSISSVKEGQSILVVITGFKGSIPQLALPGTLSKPLPDDMIKESLFKDSKSLQFLKYNSSIASLEDTTDLNETVTKCINEEDSEANKQHMDVCENDDNLSFEDISPGMTFTSYTVMKKMQGIGLIISLKNSFLAVADAMHVPVEAFSLSGHSLGPCIVLWIERNERQIGVSFLPHLFDPALQRMTFNSLLSQSVNLPPEIAFTPTNILPGVGFFLTPSIKEGITNDVKFFYHSVQPILITSIPKSSVNSIAPKFLTASYYDWNPIDGTIIVSDSFVELSDAKSIVRKATSVSSEKSSQKLGPGSILWGIVSRIDSKSMLINCSIDKDEPLYGICPRFHWFEKNYSIEKENSSELSRHCPLAVGDKKKFRILSLMKNTKKGVSSPRLLLTRKPTLLRSEYPPITTVSNIIQATSQAYIFCHGYVLVVKETFVIFGFYGEARGILPIKNSAIKPSDKTFVMMSPGDVMELAIVGFNERKLLYYLSLPNDIDRNGPHELKKNQNLCKLNRSSSFAKNTIVYGCFERLCMGYGLFSFITEGTTSSFPSDEKLIGFCPLISFPTNILSNSIPIDLNKPITTKPTTTRNTTDSLLGTPSEKGHLAEYAMHPGTMVKFRIKATVKGFFLLEAVDFYSSSIPEYSTASQIYSSDVVQVYIASANYDVSLTIPIQQPYVKKTHKNLDDICEGLGSSQVGQVSDDRSHDHLVVSMLKQLAKNHLAVSSTTSLASPVTPVSLNSVFLGPIVGLGLALQGPPVVLRPWDVQPLFCLNETLLSEREEEFGPSITNPDSDILSALFHNSSIIRKGVMIGTKVMPIIPILSSIFNGSLWKETIETNEKLICLDKNLSSTLQNTSPLSIDNTDKNSPTGFVKNSYKEELKKPRSNPDKIYSMSDEELNSPQEVNGFDDNTKVKRLANMPVVGWVSGIHPKAGIFLRFSDDYCGRVLPKNATSLFSKTWYKDHTMPKLGAPVRTWIVPGTSVEDLSKMSLSLKGPILRNKSDTRINQSSDNASLLVLEKLPPASTPILEDRSRRNRGANILSTLSSHEDDLSSLQSTLQKSSTAMKEDQIMNENDILLNRQESFSSNISSNSCSEEEMPSMPIDIESNETSFNKKSQLSPMDVDETERALADSKRTPCSIEDYEKMILADPSSSLIWIEYMAFLVTTSNQKVSVSLSHDSEKGLNSTGSNSSYTFLSDVELNTINDDLSGIIKARTVAERALISIPYRAEQEKLNLWIAWLRLEFSVLVKAKKLSFKEFDHILKESLARSPSPKAILLETFSLLTQQLNDISAFQSSSTDVIDNCGRVHQHPKATDTMVTLLKEKRTHVERLMLARPELRASGKIWLAIWKSHVSDPVKAKAILKRASDTLTGTAKIKLQTRCAMHLYFLISDGNRDISLQTYSSAANILERARSLFESFLGEHPKRFDIWQLYLNAEQRLLSSSILSKEPLGVSKTCTNYKNSNFTISGESSDENDANNFLTNATVVSSMPREMIPDNLSTSSFGILPQVLTDHKLGSIAYVRGLFERLSLMPFSSKKMKSIFKAFLAFEKHYGSSDNVEHVCQLAVAYVERTSVPS